MWTAIGCAAHRKSDIEWQRNRMDGVNGQRFTYCHKLTTSSLSWTDSSARPSPPPPPPRHTREMCTREHEGNNNKNYVYPNFSHLNADVSGYWSIECWSSKTPNNKQFMCGVSFILPFSLSLSHSVRNQSVLRFWWIICSSQCYKNVGFLWLNMALWLLCIPLKKHLSYR